MGRGLEGGIKIIVSNREEEEEEEEEEEGSSPPKQRLDSGLSSRRTSNAPMSLPRTCTG